jgi:hypothetical protein
VCFVWISEQTAIISLYRIKWLVFITETECVYSAVRTESLHVIQDNFPLKGRAMRHACSRRRPPTAYARVRSQISLYEICGEQSGPRTGFSPGTSPFPCQYHSTIFPLLVPFHHLSPVSTIPPMLHTHLPSSTCSCQYKKKRVKIWTL